MLYRNNLRPEPRGAVTVEFAGVALILFTFMFSIFEYGRFLMVRQLVDNAAREGARQAAANSPFKWDSATSKYVSQTLATSDIQQTVMNYLVGQQLKNSSNNPLTTADILVYRADPVTGAIKTDAPKLGDWTQCSFGETIAVSVSVKYDPILPGFHFIINPDPITFKCLMQSEANQ